MGIGLREYKSTHVDKGLNYFISVNLLILVTSVSRRPCFKVAKHSLPLRSPSHDFSSGINWHYRSQASPGGSIHYL